jgi:hypothetical protein
MASRNTGGSGNRPQPRSQPRDINFDYDERRPRRGGAQRMGLGETVIKALIRSIASSLGRVLARTITGRMR